MEAFKKNNQNAKQDLEKRSMDTDTMQQDDQGEPDELSEPLSEEAKLKEEESEAAKQLQEAKAAKLLVEKEKAAKYEEDVKTARQSLTMPEVDNYEALDSEKKMKRRASATGMHDKLRKRDSAVKLKEKLEALNKDNDA